MGTWSRLTGDIFLDCSRRARAAVVDVGCGNGAFTELLTERCAPRNSRDRSVPMRSSALQRDGRRTPRDVSKGDAMALLSGEQL